MKKFTVLLTSVLLATSMAFVACSDDDDDEDKTPQYTVNYETRIGTAPEPIKVKYGSLLKEEQLPTLSSNGYSFEGWDIIETSSYGYTTKRIVANQYTMTGGITLYASWSFTVTLDANGGTGTSGTFKSPVPKGHWYSGDPDYTVEIPLPQDVGITAPSGKTFVCWNDSADGTGTSFRAGEDDVYTNKLWTSSNNKITRLYAVWRNSSESLKIATQTTAEKVLSTIKDGDTLIYLGQTPNRSWRTGMNSIIKQYLDSEDIKITLDLSYHDGTGLDKQDSYTPLFQSCKSIKKVVLGNAIGKNEWILSSRYDSSAFYGCKNLEEVEFADTIVAIPEYAFAYCNLKSITIPSNIKRISARALYGNSNLTSVAFKNAEGWKSIKTREAIDVSTPATNAQKLADYNDDWCKNGIICY